MACAASTNVPATSTKSPRRKRTCGSIRIGVSGWRYKGWRGVFYPPRLPQRQELAFAAKTFNTVEINGTFYSLQRPTSFKAWAAETPDDFVFAVKGSRFITHMKKLRDIDTALANLLASGLLALGTKTGPILWQFSPQMSFDLERFTAFFRLLPRNTVEAARLAEGCDDRMLGRSLLTTEIDLPLRHAVEIRHKSFCTPGFIDLLREHDIGLVAADTVEWPLLFDVTSTFVYVRLHGSEQLYVSGYDEAAIDRWAHRVVAWAMGDTPAATDSAKEHAQRISAQAAPKLPRDVYVYFDNDAKVRAPADALALRRRVDELLVDSES